MVVGFVVEDGEGAMDVEVVEEGGVALGHFAREGVVVEAHAQERHRLDARSKLKTSNR